MKTLKFLGMTLLMVMLAINFTACSDDNEEAVSNPNDIIGKWELTWTKGWELNDDGHKEYWDEADSGLYFVFKDDGTGYHYEDYGSNAYFNWKLEGNQLSVTYTQFDGADIYKVEELNSSTLTITSTDDDEVDTSTYKKVAG
jgi:hypothetical protein